MSRSSRSQFLQFVCLKIDEGAAMSSGIVSYTKQYQSEAAQAHTAGIKYFLGETNSGENSSCFMSMRFGVGCMCMFILCGVQLLVAAAESVRCVFNHPECMSRTRSERSC